MPEMIEFMDTHWSGGIAKVRIHVVDAIEWQKQDAQQRNDFQYVRDEHALEDFMANTRAYYIEEDQFEIPANDEHNEVATQYPEPTE